MLELMPDRPAPQPKGAVLAPRRVLLNTLTVLYCPVLFLALDFAYSTFTRGQEQARAARIFDPVYLYGLAPKIDGYDVWGESCYRLLTNSIGFKDASTRDVPLQSNTRRVLLMGDSLVEGIGIPHERTFAGLLNEAMQAGAPIRVSGSARREDAEELALLAMQPSVNDY